MHFFFVKNTSPCARQVVLFNSNGKDGSPESIGDKNIMIAGEYDKMKEEWCARFARVTDFLITPSIPEYFIKTWDVNGSQAQLKNSNEFACSDSTCLYFTLSAGMRVKIAFNISPLQIPEDSGYLPA